MSEATKTLTCGEAGWHLSRYLVFTPINEQKSYAAMNLYQGSFTVLNQAEAYLLSIAEELDEDHPVLEKLKKFGLIVNFDERAALYAAGRLNSFRNSSVCFTICPTMGCNFDCPYCFENHRAGKMDQETQDAVVSLAEKMLDCTGIRNLYINWFGGEPLLVPDIIENLTGRLRKVTEKRGGEYNAKIVTNGYLLTAENIALLARCGIERAQVTLDGLGEMHDRTRCLAGGGATFETITKNLRENKIPFVVDIRHNVYEDNLEERQRLKDYVDKLARESGNSLHYYANLVAGSRVMEEKGNPVEKLADQAEIMDVGLKLEAERYGSKPGIHCMANCLVSVGIDDQGRLHKCLENVDKAEESFGDVRRWDIRDPFRTADNPDLLTHFLNTCCPSPAPECVDCLWLPMCCGGCPRRRLNNENVCFSFKDDPQAFALAVYKALGEKSLHQKKAPEPRC